MTWDTELYRDKHAFVWQAGLGVLDWLSPQPGERVVDLGCGTGELTVRIAGMGALVTGIDASADMIDAARERFPSVEWRVADARDFTVDEPVDAVFSNAALHWVNPHGRTLERVAAALRPGGRFVAEFGGRGNVAVVVASVEHALRSLGLPALKHPWFFPSVGEYTGMVEAAGLRVTRAEWFERPTPLVGGAGFRDWLLMFADGWLAALDRAERDAVIAVAEASARPSLYRDGQWIADYARIRVLAVRP